MFYYPKETEMTTELLNKLIRAHQKHDVKRYERLENMNSGDHKILHRTPKADYKPDERYVANFAGYITKTFNGFFIGIPVKKTMDDPVASEFLNDMDDRNDQDDIDAELAENTSVYGHCFEIVYTNEEAEPCTAMVPPTEGFCVYDDTIDHAMLFMVRYYSNQGKLEGSFSDADKITYFSGSFNALVIGESELHYFGGVPAVEYVENADRIGTFERVETLINAYDKTLSEKGNDVDAFADAYLSILGAKLDNDDLRQMRDNRIINLVGDDAEKVIVQFLERLESDETQEHLLDRLERLIYQLSMVANINDEGFGNASGISLAYKLLPMSNMAAVKERKFKKAMKRRYQLIGSLPRSVFGSDAWKEIKFTFTRNLPNNVMEEADTAGKLAGVVSKKTQLSVLSIVDDVDKEIAEIETESGGMDAPARAPNSLAIQEGVSADEINNAAVQTAGRTLNGAQTASLIQIVLQYQQGVLTLSQAVNIISTAIGISKEEAAAIIAETA